MTTVTKYDGEDLATRATCLERLATALSGYSDLDLAIRANAPVPCLAVSNTAAPLMSETVTVSAAGDRLMYMWSWGKRIADVGDPDRAAEAIAYVLSARDARLAGPVKAP